MFRLQHRVFQGFPDLCLSSCMPCTPAHSPLFEPDVRVSRIRLSDKLSPQGMRRELTGMPSKLDETQAGERRVVGLLPLEDLHLRSGILPTQAVLLSLSKTCLKCGPFAPRALP